MHARSNRWLLIASQAYTWANPAVQVAGQVLPGTLRMMQSKALTSSALACSKPTWLQLWHALL